MRFLVMFVTAVCVLFLIKLRWPKKKNFCDLIDFTLSDAGRLKGDPLGVKGLSEECIYYLSGRGVGGRGFHVKRAGVLVIPYRGRKTGFGSFKGVQPIKVYSGSFPGNLRGIDQKKKNTGDIWKSILSVKSVTCSGSR